MHLDLIQTLACAGIVLFAGAWIRDRTPLLARYNLPAPVIGGLLMALVNLVFQSGGWAGIRFDTTLLVPLMVAFFTSIGFGASLALLRVGGPQVLLFLLISSGAAILQNLVGMGIAVPFGLPPLFGVLAGSVTLTGGPATGLAFAPLFQSAGVPAAASVALAAAMVGIISGGLIGSPIGTMLIERARTRRVRQAREVHTEEPLPPELRPESAAGSVDANSLLKGIVLLVTAMGIGTWVSGIVASLGVTLPAYIGAMLVASVIRNVDDRTGLFGLPARLLEDLGSAGLSLFLAMALMNLQLWELVGIALPLLAILAVQVVIVALLSLFLIPRVMGRDFDAAVMSSGFAGFMLGTTANAMANMEALVKRYGPAPRAFLVVPIVGAFFIDFVNALIITLFLNL